MPIESDAASTGLFSASQIRAIELQAQKDELVRANEELELAHRKLFDVFEFAPVGYVVLDERGTILDTNLAASDLLGTHRPDILNTQFHRFIAPHHQAGFISFCRSLLLDGARHQCELGLIVNGSHKDVQMHGVVSEDTERNSICCLITLIDITERKHAQAIASESELKYRRLHDSMRDGYAAVDLDGRITDCNDCFLEMLGYDRSELIGLNFKDITSVTPKAIADAQIIAEQLATRGYSDVFEKEYHRKDGSLIPAEVRAFQLKDDEGKPCGAWAIARDITERKQVEKALHDREELLRLTLDAVQDGVWDWNLQTGKATFSPHYYTMLGYDPYEFPQEYSSWRSLVHPDDIVPAEEAINRHIEHGEGYSVDLRMRMKSGEWRWILTRGMVVESDSEGRPVRMVGTHSDITDRRQAEQARAQSEKEYRDLVENAREGIWMVNRDDVTILANRRLCELLGYTPSQMMGRTLYSFLSDEEARKARIDMDLRRRGVTQHVSTELTGSDGTSIPVRLVAWPTYDSDGHYDGATAFVTDMTEQRQLEAQLRQSQRLEAIGSLIGGVSHEFKNLLMGMSAYAEVLQIGLGADHPQIGVTHDLLHCVDRARKLIDKLLAFGKRQNIDPRPTDVNAMVLESKSLLDRLVGEHIELDMSVCDEPLIVSADPSLIEQVIINLVVNAHDAMLGGGVLTVRTRKRVQTPHQKLGGYSGLPQEYAEIIVSDTGSGMDDFIREHIFEPFFTTKDSAGHTGLGLSVAYGIIQQHGGRIEVTSIPGVGSRLSVLIPTIEAIIDHHVEADGPMAVGGSETILLVEDEEMVRIPLKSALEGWGYHVLTAANGIEGTEAFRASEETVALVITDVVMPKAGGIQLYEDVRTIKPETKFLFMSGYAMQSVGDQFSPPPDETLISKPFSLTDFAANVREILDS